jgi:sugar phosphate isomerase/epimerase
VKVAVSALHLQWRDIEYCLDRVRGEFGLDGVELSWDVSFNSSATGRKQARALRSLKGKTGLMLSAHIWDDLGQLGPGPGEQVLLDWLDLCDETGVSGLVVHGGSYPDQNEGIARVRGILKNVVGAFERRGVVLNVENHYPHHYRNSQELFSAPWEFHEIFNLDSPALRFCFDTGHGHLAGNWEALLREVGPWLGYVHLADNFGVYDDHCMFRHGTVPWDSMFDTLYEAGYDGPFCVEFPVREDTAPFRACVAELRSRWGVVPAHDRWCGTTSDNQAPIHPIQ